MSDTPLDPDLLEAQARANKDLWRAVEYGVVLVLAMIVSGMLVHLFRDPNAPLPLALVGLSAGIPAVLTMFFLGRGMWRFVGVIREHRRRLRGPQARVIDR